MTLLDQLSKNKGTVSSALGKAIAVKILTGNTDLLKETIPLVYYEPKNLQKKHIRAGAAKIVECVAEKNPKLIAPYLEKLISCLEVDEPQTKWMVFMTLGYCAALKPNIAEKGLPYAKKYIFAKKDGQLCLVGAIDKYLGLYGKVSKENAIKAYALLVESSNNVIMNEHDWIMEGFIDIVDYLNSKQKGVIIDFVNGYENFPRTATQKRREKLLLKCK